MKNNKGFTVVELLSTFVLTMILTTLLFEILLEVKSIYNNASLQTAVLNENALIARELNRQITTGNTPRECAGNMCTLRDGTDFSFNSNTELQIGNRIFTLPDGATFGDTYVIENSCETGAVLTSGNENCLTILNYVVTSDKFEKDIESNVVLSYLG